MGRRFKHTRLLVQSGWTLLTNSFVIGFVQGRIYTGSLKSICLPGLNCYSCPGSLGSCPIGALQATVGSKDHQVPFYLLGFFLIVGTIFGRFICGFLCPFGLIQELFHKIPLPKKIKTFKGDCLLRFVKYGILLVFVILLPMLVVDAVGNGSPWFCEWICPAGTLEAGIPLVLVDPYLQDAIGFLFNWKLAILGIIIVLSILIWRPFCKYLCPLGAIYALFNKVSVYRYSIDENACTHCDTCKGACPMNIHPQQETNHPECVRCGTCKDVCPEGAISSGFKLPDFKTKEGEKGSI